MAKKQTNRHCRRCGQDKPREAFYNITKAKDGKDRCCKACRDGYERPRYPDFVGGAELLPPMPDKVWRGPVGGPVRRVSVVGLYLDRALQGGRSKTTKLILTGEK